MPKFSRAMGFDFGMRRIGVATLQSITSTAEPLDILKATDGIPDWGIIATLIKAWQPDILVVGLPLNMDGSEQEITFAAKKFARRLGAKFKLPYTLVDERLTTIEARHRARATTSDKVDAVAAAIILESWSNDNT